MLKLQHLSFFSFFSLETYSSFYLAESIGTLLIVDHPVCRSQFHKSECADYKHANFVPSARYILLSKTMFQRQWNYKGINIQ